MRSPLPAGPQPPSPASAISALTLGEAKAESCLRDPSALPLRICAGGQQISISAPHTPQGLRLPQGGPGKATQPHPSQCPRNPAKIGSLRKRLALTAFTWSLVAPREINSNYPQLQSLHCLAYSWVTKEKLQSGPGTLRILQEPGLAQRIALG